MLMSGWNSVTKGPRELGSSDQRHKEPEGAGGGWAQGRRELTEGWGPVLRRGRWQCPEQVHWSPWGSSCRVTHVSTPLAFANSEQC